MAGTRQGKKNPAGKLPETFSEFFLPVKTARTFSGIRSGKLPDHLLRTGKLPVLPD
jgi:hypothetical protein